MVSRRQVLGGLVIGSLSSSAGPRPAWAATGLGAKAESAFFYGFPVFEFARTGWAAAMPDDKRPEHRFNQIIHRRGFSDHTARQITAPNNDTVYSSARLDLTSGPVLLEVPAVPDRYFSVAFMSAYTDNFACIGTRETRGQGGRLFLLGPGYAGPVPEGAMPVKAPTSDVWMLARILADDAGDLPAANAIQDRIKILQSAAPLLPKVRPQRADDPANFLDTVNEMLGRSHSRDNVRNSVFLQRADRFAEAGLAPGKAGAWEALSPAWKQAWQEAIASGLAQLKSGFALAGKVKDGWRSPPDGIGAPLENDRLRSAVALSGLAALEREEATYFRADQDSGGQALDGTAGPYRMTLPSSVPVDAFWSLSMYSIEPDGRLFFSVNPIKRCAIGDRTKGIVRDASGTLTIFIQKDAPTGPEAANWLPAPAGRFAMIFRAYLPRPEILSGAWTPPAVMRLI